jgi:hypothetical protein
MRRLLLSSLICTAIPTGAFLLHFSFLYGGEANNLPTSVPFPSDGFSVSDVFTLAAGGQFALEVITPASEGEKDLLHREQPPLQCNISLTISGPAGFTMHRSITGLHNGGWTADTNIYFPEALVQLPSGGQYVISFAGHNTVPLFRDRGAMIQLTRFQPAGHELRPALVAWAAYGCLVLAAVAAIFAVRA